MEYDEIWTPRCAVPSLVTPVRLDRAGESGPTRHMARRGRWRRSTYGWHVGAGVDRCVDQRIVEESMRLGGRGAVTGWAALRLRGVAYCDGEPGLPVILAAPRQLANTPGSVATRERVDVASRCTAYRACRWRGRWPTSWSGSGTCARVLCCWTCASPRG